MAKILIVDDSSLSRRMMRGILQSDGHEVIEATDGMSAIERYFVDQPDLVVLDLVMTGMTGEEVLEKLRQMDREARVIVASADLQTMTRQRVEEAGAVGFVNKPFIAATVLNAVNAVLKGAA